MTDFAWTIFGLMCQFSSLALKLGSGRKGQFAAIIDKIGDFRTKLVRLVYTQPHKHIAQVFRVESMQRCAFEAGEISI